MSPFTILFLIWSLFVLRIAAQGDPNDPGRVHQFRNFRSDCSTPELDGTILTSTCEQLCSWCLTYFISSIDLNKCVGYDGWDSLIPQKEQVIRSC